MSGMASNYDMPMIFLGQAAAILSLVLAGVAAYLLVDDGLRSWMPMLLITAGYGAMMFASSYVEEEQHFWYWATTAWLVVTSLPTFSG